MTPLERYRAVVEGSEPDIVPRVPILMQYAAEYIGSNYGAFAFDYRVLVEANMACAEHFGFDQVSAISDPYRETEGFGGHVAYPRDTVPTCTAPLEEGMDLKLLNKPDPENSVRMRDRVDAIRAYDERCGGRFSILGWIEGPAAEAATLRRPVQFLMDLVDDPDGLCRLMDICTENGIRFAEAQLAAGADTIGIGDAIASQVSPKMYETYVLPREKRMVDAIHAAGGLVKLHICGNIKHLLSGIATLGVDILDVDHMVDLAYTRSVAGPKVVLTGNVDPVAGIKDGTPVSIRRAIEACRDSAGDPYMVNAGCEVPAGTPEENLMAMCEPVPFANGE